MEAFVHTFVLENENQWQLLKRVKVMKRKKKYKTQRNDNNRKTKKLDYQKVFLGLSSVLVAWYPIVNIVYNELYQIKSEEFYGIPGKYFHDSVNKSLMYLGCIVIYILICAIPVIIKKSDEKNLEQKKASNVYVYFLSVITGLGLGMLNVYNWLSLLKQVHKKGNWFGRIVNFLSQNTRIMIVMIIIILLGALALFGITYNLNTIKSEFSRNLVIKVFGIAFSLSFALMICGTICKLKIKLEDKTKYELVFIEDKQYVVLAEDDGKILAVPFIKTRNGDYVFDTRYYYFIEKYQGSYQYVDMENTPQIIKYK